jgi:hypothetical protein
LVHILHINLPGAVICGLAFAAAFGVGYLVGTSEEGSLMILAGPLCTVMDSSFRMRKAERRWFHPDAGGNLFFIPIWLLGIVWLALGIVDTIRGQA